MAEHFGNDYRRPWAYEHYTRPIRYPDYYWARLLDPFLERQEKILYLLVGLVLVKVKFEGENGSAYARLGCTVMEVDGTPVPAEQSTPAAYEGRESPTPEEQQEILRVAMEKCGVSFGKITLVSDKYVEGHLKKVRLQQRIIATRKGA